MGRIDHLQKKSIKERRKKLLTDFFLFPLNIVNFAFVQLQIANATHVRIRKDREEGSSFSLTSYLPFSFLPFPHLSQSQILEREIKEIIIFF